MNRAPRGSGQAGGLTDLTPGWGGEVATVTLCEATPTPIPSPEGEGRSQVIPSRHASSKP